MRQSTKYLITGIILLIIAEVALALAQREWSFVFGGAGLVALAIAFIMQVREDWPR